MTGVHFVCVFFIARVGVAWRFLVRVYLSICQSVFVLLVLEVNDACICTSAYTEQGNSYGRSRCTHVST